MKLSKTSILIGFILFIFSGCGKYEDGPWFSLRSKKARLANNWMVEKVLVNGIDSTNAVTGREVMTYNISKQGVITIICKDLTKGWVDTQNGSWDFINSKEDIRVNVVSEVTHIAESHVWHILKLEKKECWYSSAEDNKRIEEYHLIPQ